MTGQIDPGAIHHVDQVAARCRADGVPAERVAEWAFGIRLVARDCAKGAEEDPDDRLSWAEITDLLEAHANNFAAVAAELTRGGNA